MVSLFSWLIDKKEVDQKLLEIAKDSPLMKGVRIVQCEDGLYKIQYLCKFREDKEVWSNSYSDEYKELVDVERHFIRIFENREANKRSRTVRKVL